MIVNNKLVTAFLLLIAGLVKINYAQLPPEVLNRLDRDTAGFIHFENVNKLVEFYDKHLSSHLLNCLDFCVEDPYPAMSAETCDKLRLVYDSLSQSLGRLDSVDLIVHSMDHAKFPEFTLFIYLDKESSKEFLRLSIDLKKIYTDLSAPGKELNSQIDSNKRDGNKPDKSSNESESSESTTTSQFEQWKIESRQIADRECVVLTNTNVFAGSIENDLDTASLKELRTDRRYRSFELFLDRNRTRQTTLLMTAFFEPGKLRPLFDPKNNSSLWKALGIKELPVAAVQLSMANDGSFVADSMITMTQPPSGTAAQWLAYRDLETIPVFEDTYISVSAKGIDAKKAIEQQMQFYETAYGTNTFLNEVLNHFGRNDVEFMEHLSKRTDQKVVFAILTETGKDFLTFDRILNRESMELVIDATAKAQDNLFAERGLKLERSESEGNILWSYPDSEALRRQFEPTAFAIVGDWSLQGTQAQVKKYYDGVVRNGSNDRPWQELLSSNATPFTTSFQPVDLTKFESSSWLEDAKLILADRVIERGGSSTDRKVVEEIKSVRLHNKRLEIRSSADRIAEAKFMIACAIIEQFGDVTSLFRNEGTFFENRVIICPSENPK